MKHFKQFLAAALVAISASAIAHGDEDHAKKAGPVKKEQKDWGIAGDAMRCPSNFVFQRAALMPPGTAEKHAC